MLFRRFGRPSLLGLAAGTAVVAGTATAVGGAVAGRQQRQAEERAEAEAYQAQASAPPVAPQPDLMSELERLGALKQQGLLSDAEFSAAKQRLLAG